MSTSQPKLVFSTRLPQAAMTALAADYQMDAPIDEHTRRNLGDSLARLEGADAFCPVFFDKLDANFINTLPASVKIIASYGVGVNHIDLAAAKARGLTVTNTPDVLVDDTADIAMGLMIATSRNFYERETSLRSGKWGAPSATANLSRTLTGKTLGIIGFGPIGQAVAKRAKAFGMTIICHSRTPKPEVEAALGATHVTLDELLTTADVVSLHCALTDETHHIINEDTLGKMKTAAILINTGRGPLVDEAALVAALKGGAIRGAGLDVYEFEPKLADGLIALENVSLLPHIGSATIETRDAMGLRVKENLDRFFKGAEVLDRVV